MDPSTHDRLREVYAVVIMTFVISFSAPVIAHSNDYVIYIVRESTADFATNMDFHTAPLGTAPAVWLFGTGLLILASAA